MKVWTATDACGNSATTQQIITVQDIDAPVISGVPSDETVECDAVPPVPQSGVDVTVLDNCDATPVLTLQNKTINGGCPNSYQIIRTWTATDICGNTSEASYTLTVEDTQAPEFSNVPFDVPLNVMMHCLLMILISPIIVILLQV
ncbi:MAG: hypothetical protein R2784_14135 [Saprospiraceae bacterium]